MEPAIPPDDDLEYDEYDDDEFYDDDSPRGADIQRGRRRGCAPTYLIIGCFLGVFACCVLPFCALFAAGAGLAIILSNSEATVSGTEQVTIPDDTLITLDVDNNVGRVRILPGPTDAVTVDYTKRAHGWSESDARQELDNITVDVQLTDETVTVQVKTDRTEDNFWTLANEVDMDITVPPSLYLKLETNVGLIDIGDVQARSLDATTNVGEIRFSGAIGPNINQTYRLESNTGAINVKLPSDVYLTLDAVSDVGNVTISDQFETRSNVIESDAGTGTTWSGTLGEGPETPPTLQLHTNTGAINVNLR